MAPHYVSHGAGCRVMYVGLDLSSVQSRRNDVRQWWRFWVIAAPLLCQIAGLTTALALAVFHAPGVEPPEVMLAVAGVLFVWALPLLLQSVALVEGLSALAAKHSSTARWLRVLAEALVCAVLAGLVAIRLPWVALLVPANLYLALLAGLHIARRRHPVRSSPGLRPVKSEMSAAAGSDAMSETVVRARPFAPRRLRRVMIISCAGVVCVSATLTLFTAAQVFASPWGEPVGATRSPAGGFRATASFIDWSAGAMSAANDGLWRVAVSRRQADGWSPPRTIFLAFVPAMDNGGPFPWRWRSESLLTIAGKTYDVRTARAIHARGLSHIQYVEGWAEVVLVFVGVLAVGIAGVFVVRRRILRTGA